MEVFQISSTSTERQQKAAAWYRWVNESCQDWGIGQCNGTKDGDFVEINAMPLRYWNESNLNHMHSSHLYSEMPGLCWQHASKDQVVALQVGASTIPCWNLENRRKIRADPSVVGRGVAKSVCLCVWECQSQHPRKKWFHNSILISSAPLVSRLTNCFQMMAKKKVITRVFIQMAVYYFIITNVRYGTTTSDTTCTRFNNDCSGWMKWLYRYEKKKS